MSRKNTEWDPVRRGDTYCSPACGCGCTFADYKAAVAAGKALSKALGKGWTHTVWENAGWNCNAVSPCGCLKVHVDWRKPLWYSAYLSESKSPGGRWVKTSRSPKFSVRSVLREARSEAEVLSDLVGRFKNWK